MPASKMFLEHAPNLQGEQLNMAVFFWYIVKKLLVHCTSVKCSLLDMSLKVPEKHGHV